MTHARRANPFNPKELNEMSAHLRQLEPHRSALDFFGAELRHRRIEAGLSLHLLADKIFVSNSLLGLVEAAQRFPSLDMAVRCDDVLEAGGALTRLHAFVVAERDEQRQSRQSGLDPVETVQLRRLLAAITLVSTVHASPASLDVLDLIDSALSSAVAAPARTDRASGSRKVR